MRGTDQSQETVALSSLVPNHSVLAPHSGTNLIALGCGWSGLFGSACVWRVSGNESKATLATDKNAWISVDLEGQSCVKAMSVMCGFCSRFLGRYPWVETNPDEQSYRSCACI